MATITPNYLCTQVEGFSSRTTLFLTDITSRTLPSENRVREELTRINTAFTRLKAELDEHLLSLSCETGDIAEDRIPELMENTALQDRLTEAFQRVRRIIERHYPALSAASASIAPLADHTPKNLLFYYSGKGDLYLRGEGLTILDPHGKPMPLSWEEDASPIPLKPVADDLWQATVYVPPGGTGKYKVINNVDWSTGPDNLLDSSTQTKLQIPSFDGSCSLCLPIKLNSCGYRMCIYGEGRVRFPTGEIRELHWDTPLEMERMGSAMLRADIEPIGDVQYKFCLVGRSAVGEIIWEKGGNRILRAGETDLVLPSFELPSDTEIQELTPAQIQRETLSLIKVEERRHAEEARAKAIKGSAARPKAIAHLTAGDVFRPEEILVPHDFSEIAPLSGEVLGGAGIIPADTIIKGRAKDGKWVIFQQGATGCSAGASACLMMDNGVVPDIASLKARVSSPYTIIATDLQNKGLPVIQTPVSLATSLADLRAIIRRNGSLALRISLAAGNGHAIVVDQVSDDLNTVRLRDPWHGWDITVTAESFLRYWRHALTSEASIHFASVVIQVDRSAL